MPAFKDLSGRRFGRLTVIELDRKEQKGNRLRYYWKCICDCGKQCVARTDSLTGGNVQSCGCLHREQAIENVSKHHSHGQSGTRLYGIWQKIKDRCQNKNVPCYERYGGRGISICEEWRDDFQAFYQWAKRNGYSDDLTIDRIDNSSGYSPENCRWVGAKAQAGNRRSNIKVLYRGEEMTLLEASEKSGLSYSALNARWHRGVRGDDLFSELASKGSKREVLFNGKVLSLKELSEHTGVNLNTLKTRYRQGKRGNDLIK